MTHCRDAIVMYDSKYFRFRMQYIVQVGVALVFMFFVLLALGQLTQELLLSAIGASSLASSVTTAFVAPGSKFTRAINVMGGYAIGITLGFSCFLCEHLFISLFPGTSILVDGAIFGSIAVGLSLLFMAMLKLEHPPAAGFALGLVLEKWDHYTILIVFIAVVTLTLLKRFCGRWLIDLV